MKQKRAARSVLLEYSINNFHE